jgi:hypothetical protein
LAEAAAASEVLQSRLAAAGPGINLNEASAAAARAAAAELDALLRAQVIGGGPLTMMP